MDNFFDALEPGEILEVCSLNESAVLYRPKTHERQNDLHILTTENMQTFLNNASSLLCGIVSDALESRGVRIEFRSVRDEDGNILKALTSYLTPGDSEWNDKESDEETERVYDMQFVVVIAP